MTTQHSQLKKLLDVLRHIWKKMNKGKLSSFQLDDRYQVLVLLPGQPCDVQHTVEYNVSVANTTTFLFITRMFYKNCPTSWQRRVYESYFLFQDLWLGGKSYHYCIEFILIVISQLCIKGNLRQSASQFLNDLQFKNYKFILY